MKSTSALDGPSCPKKKWNLPRFLLTTQINNRRPRSLLRSAVVACMTLPAIGVAQSRPPSEAAHESTNRASQTQWEGRWKNEIESLNRAPDFEQSVQIKSRLDALWNHLSTNQGSSTSGVMALCRTLQSSPVNTLLLIENNLRSWKNTNEPTPSANKVHGQGPGVQDIEGAKQCLSQQIQRLDAYWKKQQIVLARESQFQDFNSDSSGAPEAGGEFEIVEQQFSVDHPMLLNAANIAKLIQPMEIMLSFDDGPDPITTPMILDTLARWNAKAIFFVCGNRIQNRSAAQAILRRIVDEGHTLGSHSHSHSATPLPRMSPANAVEEILRGHIVANAAIGKIWPFFRFPYGAGNSYLRNFLSGNQVTEFHWSIDSVDWSYDPSNGGHTSPQELLQSAIAKVDRRQGGLILFHDILRRTAEVLDPFLADLHAKGYRLVLPTLAESHRLTQNQPLAGTDVQIPLLDGSQGSEVLPVSVLRAGHNARLTALRGLLEPSAESTTGPSETFPRFP